VLLAKEKVTLPLMALTSRVGLMAGITVITFEGIVYPVLTAVVIAALIRVAITLPVVPFE
jgi:hypothetical protein